MSSMTNHPSCNTPTGSGMRVPPADALRYWCVQGLYVLARSAADAERCYSSGEGRSTLPRYAYCPPARHIVRLGSRIRR